MTMLDWVAYRHQLGAGVSHIGKVSPDLVKGYVAMSGAGRSSEQFSEKTRELIALAVAVSLRCDACIAIHSEAARRHGATEAELVEALGVAISVNAGATIAYSVRTLEAFGAG